MCGFPCEKHTFWEKPFWCLIDFSMMCRAQEDEIIVTIIAADPIPTRPFGGLCDYVRHLPNIIVLTVFDQAGEFFATTRLRAKSGRSPPQ